LGYNVAQSLNFYLGSVDIWGSLRKARRMGKMRHQLDTPAIGLLLCKSRNKIIAEYALKGIEAELSNKRG
jgi:hypothetical protein